MTVGSVWDLCARLADIVGVARREGDRCGFFAALYLAVSEHSARRLREVGRVKRPDLLERVVTAFFRRYDDALEARRTGRAPSAPWQAVFASVGDESWLVLQHLLASANAHITYDLPIAISDALTADEMDAFKDDYHALNDVFARLFPAVVEALAATSPGLRRVIEAGDDGEVRALGFSMRAARETAWRNARLRERLPSALREGVFDPFLATAAGVIHTMIALGGATVAPALREPGGQRVDATIDLLRGALGEVPIEGRRRVVVLGGGVGGLMAALCLTDPRNPSAATTDVTVYQMGWRLGGKAATGRNLDPGMGERIQEHGLHAFFGFYENTFRAMHDVFREMKRPPFARWVDACEGFNGGFYWEPWDGDWRHWRVDNAVPNGTPGEGGISHAPSPPLRPREASAEGLRWISQKLRETSALGELAREFDELADACAAMDVTDRDLAGRLSDRIAGRVSALATTVAISSAGDDLRHTWIMANFAAACVRGALESGVLLLGYACVNDRDLRAWVVRWLYDDKGVTLNSALLRAIYEASFAFRDGDSSSKGQAFPPSADLEAGTALYGMACALFKGKGAFAYKMRLGAGDTMVSPIYQVLRDRGVRFRFFRCLQRIDVGEGRTVSHLHILRQVKVLPEEHGRDYQPLVGRPPELCWPDRPRHEQIGDGVNREHPDYEDPDGEWPRTDVETLTAVRDFDEVVLAIPPDAARRASEALVRHSPRWGAMFDHVKSVRTQAMQVWLQRTSPELGLEEAAACGRPMTLFWEDGLAGLNVFSDYSVVLHHERWAAKEGPRMVVYHCGTLPETVPSRGATAFVRARGRALLQTVGRRIYGRDAAGEEGFKWSLLVDQREPPGDGEARLDAQFFRANVTPSERYVLSVQASSQHRLPTRNPGGIGRLYIAGDWVQTPLNCGCMEATVMSGMLVSYEMTRWPPRDRIAGLDDAPRLAPEV